MLKAESQLLVCRKKLKDLESLLMRESERLKAAVDELANLERVRCLKIASFSFHLPILISLFKKSS